MYFSRFSYLVKYFFVGRRSYSRSVIYDWFKLFPGIPGTRCTRYPPHSGGGNCSFVFLLYLSIWLELFDGFRGFRGFRGLNVPCGTILIPRNVPRMVYILPVARVCPCIVRIQKLTISRGRGDTLCPFISVKVCPVSTKPIRLRIVLRRV